MSLVDGWSELDVHALSRVIQHGRTRAGFSHQLLEDLRQIAGADEVLLLEREAGSARLTAYTPHLGLVDSRHPSTPAVWAAVWDSERCAPDAGAVEPPQICAADHLHHPRIDARVHRDLAASYVVMAPLVSATAEARLVFVRRTRDFDERDHTVLGLLRPHLASAYRRCTERRGRVDALTPRQRVVLHLVARGCSNDEIASRLVLSPGTVRKHLDNAFRQLGVSSRAAAVARAFPEGVPPYPLELRDTPLVSVPRQRAN